MDLVGHWKLDEISGTTIKDSAGSNDGSWVGTELITEGTAPPDLDEWGQSPGTQWAVVANEFVGSGNTADNFLQQDFGAVVGKAYTISYTVVDNSLVGGTSTTQLKLSSASTFGDITLDSSSGAHSVTATSIIVAEAGRDFRLALLAVATSGTITLDNISVRETVDSVLGPVGVKTALLFDGVGDYIEIADNAIFTPAATAFSIVASINMTVATSFIIVGKGVYNTDAEWLFQVNTNDHLSSQMTDESVDNCFIGRKYNTALTTYQGQWIHVATTYDGGTISTGIKLYLNGNKVDNADAHLNQESFVAVENLNHPVWIGRQDPTYANGKINDVRIYNTVLSAAQINQLWNESIRAGYRGRGRGRNR